MVLEEEPIQQIIPPTPTTIITEQPKKQEPQPVNYDGQFYEHDENGKIAYKPFKPLSDNQSSLQQ